MRSFVAAASHVALIAIVMGTATAVAGAGRLDASLVASTTLVWSFVPLIQLLTGIVIVTGRTTSKALALERYLMTHRAWSLWMLALAASVLLVPNGALAVSRLALTFVVPLAVTALALMRLRRELYGDARGAAWLRVAVHQGLTLGIIAIYVHWATALSPRLVRWWTT
jgi:hypothetical protein